MMKQLRTEAYTQTQMHTEREREKERGEEEFYELPPTVLQLAQNVR